MSESGYHAWAARAPSAGDERRGKLVAAIEAIHAEVKGRYGSPRMTAELNARGHECSENTVARLMREHGIRAKAPRRFVRTTDSRHGLPVAENVLDREFDPAEPNAAWAADITYIPTADGWLYLAVVEDLFSRMIVGWSMAETMGSRVVVDALEMAVRKRLPGDGLVAHSDRGSQYASDQYQALLAEHGFVCSMSRKGNCWDNAVAERFFLNLKMERVWQRNYANHAEARCDIAAYIVEFYNSQRLHSVLGNLPPTVYERNMAAQEPIVVSGIT